MSLHPSSLIKVISSLFGRKFTDYPKTKKLNLIIQTFDNQKSKKSARRRPPFFFTLLTFFVFCSFSLVAESLPRSTVVTRTFTCNKPVNAESCSPKLKFYQTENISYPRGNELAKMPQLCSRSRRLPPSSFGVWDSFDKFFGFFKKDTVDLVKNRLFWFRLSEPKYELNFGGGYLSAIGLELLNILCKMFLRIGGRFSKM